MIPQSFITDLLNRVDIVDVVGKYVQLKKGGANFMGLCPFHNEKSPSFTVSPTKQFYHCFGCGAHGTSIGFLIEYSGMGFVDAVKDLAQNVGMVVPDADDKIPPAQRAAQQAQTLALSDALSTACDFYRAELRGAADAVAYLKKRGLTGEVAARFGMGYSPSGWDNLRKVFPDYDALALVESGLVIDKVDEDGGNKKRYDRFRERIMFPIRNVKGQVIGFGGRVMGDGEPKYLNSPETPLFQKGLELIRPVRSAPGHPRRRLRAGDGRLYGRGGAGPARLSASGRHAGNGLHEYPRAKTVAPNGHGHLQFRWRQSGPESCAPGLGGVPAASVGRQND